MRHFFLHLSLLAAAIPSGAADLPGQRADGSVLLPNQWVLRPVGQQIPLSDFPVNVAMAPDGRYAAILHCGYSEHEILVVDLKTEAVVSRTKVGEAFYGLAFSPDGSQLYCSGSSAETVRAFAFKSGALRESESFRLHDSRLRGIPCGLAISADGRTIYAANLWGHTVSRIRIDKRGAAAVDEVALAADLPREAAKAPATTDDPSITKRSNQLLDKTDANAPFPYALLLDEPHDRLYVSLWAQSSIAIVDLRTFSVLGRWPADQHPNEMLLSKDGKRLFVANANKNSVTVLNVADGKPSETLLAELRPDALPGNTPNSLELTPDGKHLFVANANINAVSVFDVARPGRARSLGFIPVGWYPTSVRVSKNGRTLYVANGKGESSKPNPFGPGSKTAPKGVKQYIGSLMTGTLSIIPLPEGDAFEAKMREWTAQAYQCVPESAKKAASQKGANAIPRKADDVSPIKYVIYIIKENRTYDQVLGDMKEGNGDPSICLFPEKVTPNHHALAREFVLLDNLYVDAEVSADGHEWSMGAYATDFVEKHWPLSYGHGKSGKFPFPAEGYFPIATPAGGYLWDRAVAAGISYRSYGEWVTNGNKAGDPGKAKTKALEGHFDPFFRGFDTGYSDQLRADRFLAELRRFEKEGEMPRLQIVRLPNDHTSGTSPGKPTPTAQVADNDLALGRIIEGLSHSAFWAKTAVFVIEDDAQNGSDHVDAHRTIGYAISPYNRRGTVDCTMYSTSSMLRTIELILGLQPMSQFDAAAMPMYAAFQAKPDLTPYRARPAQVDLDERNGKTAWGGKASLKMNFSKEDAVDDLALNEIIWKSVRGAQSVMPAPRRAAFVFTRGGKDDDDD